MHLRFGDAGLHPHVHCNPCEQNAIDRIRGEDADNELVVRRSADQADRRVAGTLERREGIRDQAELTDHGPRPGRPLFAFGRCAGGDALRNAGGTDDLVRHSDVPGLHGTGKGDTVRNREPREGGRGFAEPGNRLIELALRRGVHGGGGL